MSPGIPGKKIKKVKYIAVFRDKRALESAPSREHSPFTRFHQFLQIPKIFPNSTQLYSPPSSHTTERGCEFEKYVIYVTQLPKYLT